MHKELEQRQPRVETKAYFDIGKFVLTRGPLHFKAATSYASAAWSSRS